MIRKVAITGANGFIGLNLATRLRELEIEVVALGHRLEQADMVPLLAGVEIVFHCAGVNRPETEDAFSSGNIGMTRRLCQALVDAGLSIPVVYTSSVQAARDNAYGRSKRKAEAVVLDYGQEAGVPCHIFRLPNVFGKWSRPDYNSVVATFCHNILNDLPITIHDPAAVVELVYIDDVVAAFVALLDGRDEEGAYPDIAPVYATTVGEIADRLRAFKASRQTLMPGNVGTGFSRALYATYLSYMKPSDFAYHLTVHGDSRGDFAEILRTPDAGQVSFFTAHPGVTRGGHYHHTKNEKFLIVQGEGRFRFRHLVSGETAEIVANGTEPRIVETVPGWSHDVTNIGEDLLIVVLWANEIFDVEKPDTIARQL